MKITSSYVFNFGRKKGQRFLDVVKHDPDYVLWCAENIEWFELSWADTKMIIDNQPGDMCFDGDAWPTGGLKDPDEEYHYHKQVDKYYGQEPTVRWEQDSGMGGVYAIEIRTYPDGRVERYEHHGVEVQDGKPDYGPWWQ